MDAKKSQGGQANLGNFDVLFYTYQSSKNFKNIISSGYKFQRIQHTLLPLV